MRNIAMHKIIILKFLVFLAADINGKNHLKYQNKSKISDVYVQISKTDHPQRKIALLGQVYKHHAPCFTRNGERNFASQINCCSKFHFPKQNFVVRGTKCYAKFQ